MSAVSPAGLGALFDPAAIAVVGASPAGGYGLTTLHNLRAIGYRGAVYPVNPRHREVAGLPCYPGLRALPRPVDVVAVAVPAARVPEVIESAAEVQSQVAVVYSSGLGEGADGAGSEWAAAVRRTARCAGLRVIGPNCLGAVDFVRGCAVWPIDLPRTSLGADRGVGLVAQSGNMALTAMSSRRGGRFSRVVSCGNQLDVTAAELIDEMLCADGVTVAAAMLEAVPDVGRFSAALARAAERDVPVVVLRVGRSRLGRVATLAHTGSLSGPDHLMRALLRRYGAIDVRDLDELLATCAVLGSRRRPQGPGVGALSTSGGECALLADRALGHGLELPPLPAPAAAELAARLPPFVAPANPVDLTAATWGDAAAYRGAVEALAGVPEIDVIVHLGDRPTHAAEDAEGSWEGMISGLAQGAAAATRPVVSVTTIGDVRVEHVAALEAAGIVTLAGLEPALAALGHAAGRARSMATLRRRRPPLVDVGRRHRARRLLAGTREVVPEATAKALIGLYRIAAPPGSVVTSGAGAVAAAERIGFPVAMKLHGAGVAHKSDLGGVLLGVVDPTQARAGFGELRAQARRVGLKRASVLVERQIEAGVELIVGGRNDPRFGPVLMVGMGGVLSELVEDTVHRLAPVDREEALEMLAELRTGAALDGYRGRPSIDRDAVADVIVAVGELLAELPRVRDLDLNPILPGPGGRGCVAVDALIVLASRQEVGR